LDPFFAGGYINYYYFGYVIVATLARATTIAPAVSFNLAIATFFGLLLATSYSVGRSLTRSVTFGLVAAVFVCCIGNLNGLVQVVTDLQSVATTHIAIPLVGGIVELVSGFAQAVFAGRPPPSFDFWASTRLVPPLGIDFAEFPYFTYLFGDLHAHLMAFPMTLAAIALACSMATSIDGRNRGHIAASIVTAGLLLGAIEATNSLDFPTYALVLGLGCVVGLITRRRAGSASSRREIDRSAQASTAIRNSDPRLYSLDLLTGAAIAVMGALAAVILFPPLKQGYHPVFNTGLATIQSQLTQIRAAVAGQTPGLTPSQIAQQTHNVIVTPLTTYWEIFGLFLFLALSWLIVLATDRRSTRRTEPPEIAGARSEMWSERRQNQEIEPSAVRPSAGASVEACGEIAPVALPVGIAGVQRTAAEAGVVGQGPAGQPPSLPALQEGPVRTSSIGDARLPAIYGSKLAMVPAAIVAAGMLVLVLNDLWLLAFLLVFGSLIVWLLVARWRTLAPAEIFVLGLLLIPVALTAFSETMFIPDYL